MRRTAIVFARLAASALCRCSLSALLCVAAAAVHGQETIDSVPASRPGFLSRFIAKFDNYDTTYIEPNKYSWAAMIQGTMPVERYKIWSNSADQKLFFSPKPGFKIGPYFGWKFIFLGYSFDVTQQDSHKKQTSAFDLSLYTSRIGVDFLYRHSGDDYRLKTDDGYMEADGTVGIDVLGLNAYYILNYKHFSYPAAMSQSTVQRRSAGSLMLGASVTKHSLTFDYNTLIADKGIDLADNLCFDRLKYYDYNISVGYGYNWVFARNWLLCVSAMPAIGYKHLSAGYTLPTNITPDERSFVNRIGNAFNIDITARASIVWNTSRFYGGLAMVLRSYQYRYDNLSVRNTFGTLSLYFGLNFIRKKASQ